VETLVGINPSKNANGVTVLPEVDAAGVIMFGRIDDAVAAVTCCVTLEFEEIATPPGVLVAGLIATVLCTVTLDDTVVTLLVIGAV
jgi:hypothetical protein